MGIHKPKDRDEADFARRRLIFDDFFYLQVSLLLSVYFLHEKCEMYIKGFNPNYGGICARAHCRLVDG